MKAPVNLVTVTESSLVSEAPDSEEISISMKDGKYPRAKACKKKGEWVVAKVTRQKATVVTRKTCKMMRSLTKLR